ASAEKHAESDSSAAAGKSGAKDEKSLAQVMACFSADACQPPCTNKSLLACLGGEGIGSQLVLTVNFPLGVSDQLYPESQKKLTAWLAKQTADPSAGFLVLGYTD